MACADDNCLEAVSNRARGSLSLWHGGKYLHHHLPSWYKPLVGFLIDRGVSVCVSGSCRCGVRCV